MRRFFLYYLRFDGQSAKQTLPSLNAEEMLDSFPLPPHLATLAKGLGLMKSSLSPRGESARKRERKRRREKHPRIVEGKEKLPHIKREREGGRYRQAFFNYDSL